jgi:hypothetical protein
MEDPISDLLALSLVSYLPLNNHAHCAAVSQSFAKAAELVAKRELAVVIPCSAARAQISRLLNAGGKARGCLFWRSTAEKHAREMELLEQIGNRAKAMHPWIGSANISAGDVFAACKRAMLLSEDPSTVNAEVERWMVYIVDAVERDCFEVSIPAWQWFVESSVLDEGHAFWMCQLAHALEVPSSIIPLLKNYPTIADHVAAIADRLSVEPSLGKYGTHFRRIKDQDLRKLLKKAEAQEGPVAMPGGVADAVPMSAMLRARRSLA